MIIPENYRDKGLKEKKLANALNFARGIADKVFSKWKNREDKSRLIRTMAVRELTAASSPLAEVLP